MTSNGYTVDIGWLSTVDNFIYYFHNSYECDIIDNRKEST